MAALEGELSDINPAEVLPSPNFTFPSLPIISQSPQGGRQSNAVVSQKEETTFPGMQTVKND